MVTLLLVAFHTLPCGLLIGLSDLLWQLLAAVIAGVCIVVVAGFGRLAQILLGEFQFNLKIGFTRKKAPRNRLKEGTDGSARSKGSLTE